MTTKKMFPTIGFDRHIKIEWIAAAARIRLGTGSVEELNFLLDQADLGKEARIKNQTKINALVLDPKPALKDFIDRGLHLFNKPTTIAGMAPFAWGAAIAMYPYFAKVAEIIGRLTALQGDCATSELHRRMRESYGERKNVTNATQLVLQTQIDWGGVQRVKAGNRLVCLPPRLISQQEQAGWLIEAMARYFGKAIPLELVQSSPVIYPFRLDVSIAYVAANCPQLELRTEGAGQRFVCLHDAT
jgi:hypothetical protein